MSIKRTGNKNLKIVAATMVAIFSLMACFTASYAWFTAKRVQDEGVSEFGVGSDDSEITTISCYAIKYDGVYGASATKLISGQTNNIAMSEYDYILRDRNINTPMFLRIEIAGFDANKDLQITIPSYGSYYADGTTNIDSCLSNVVCAKFSFGLQSGSNVVVDNNELTQNTITGPVIETIYKGMRDRVANITGTPFVYSKPNKNSDITLTLSHTNVYNSDFLIPYEDSYKVVIYVCFDYYVTNSVNLVEDYVKSYNSDHSHSFRCDIGMITLRDTDVS